MNAGWTAEPSKRVCGASGARSIAKRAKTEPDRDVGFSTVSDAHAQWNSSLSHCTRCRASDSAVWAES